MSPRVNGKRPWANRPPPVASRAPDMLTALEVEEGRRQIAAIKAKLKPPAVDRRGDFLDDKTRMKEE